MKGQRNIFPLQHESKGDSASNAIVKFSSEISGPVIEMASIFLHHKASLHLPTIGRAYCHQLLEGFTQLIFCMHQ